MDISSNTFRSVLKLARPTLTDRYAVIAPPAAGKTTAAATYGWLDTDGLEVLNPTLADCNYPTWWAVLAAVTALSDAHTVLTFITGPDADASGIWISNTIVMLPHVDVHRTRMEQRKFTKDEILDVFVQRTALHIWATQRRVSIVSDASEADQWLRSKGAGFFNASSSTTTVKP